MAIAGFFHCDIIQYRAVNYHRFAILLSNERLVGYPFKCPNRRQVGGELLDHNYGSCSDSNRIIVGKDADIFCLSWMSDGKKFLVCRWPIIY